MTIFFDAILNDRKRFSEELKKSEEQASKIKKYKAPNKFLTPRQTAILDAVFELYKAGCKLITPQMIFRLIYRKGEMSDSEKKAIIDDVEELSTDWRGTVGTHDPPNPQILQIFEREHGKIDPDTVYLRDGHLLTAEGLTITKKDGTELMVWYVLEIGCIREWNRL